MAKYKCKNCGKKYLYEDVIFDKKEDPYCRICIEENFMYCEMCDAYVPMENMEDVGGRDICIDCIEKYFEEAEDFDIEKGRQEKIDIDKDEIPDRSKEIIKITRKAVQQITEEAIKYGGKNVENHKFSMIMGGLGGKISEKQVFIEEAYFLAHGNRFSVKVNLETYIKFTEYSNQLNEEGRFIVGWYCSLPDGISFFNSTNYQTQIGYQEFNKLAIALVIYPENYKDTRIQELMRIFRLREDLSDNWIELNLEIID